MFASGMAGCIIAQIFWQWTKFQKIKLKPKITISHKELSGWGKDTLTSVKKYKKKGFYINKWSGGCKFEKFGEGPEAILDGIEKIDFETEMKISTLTEIGDFKRDCIDFYNTSLDFGATPAEDYIDRVLASAKNAEENKLKNSNL
jgi:hypothetical protein